MWFGHHENMTGIDGLDVHERGAVPVAKDDARRQPARTYLAENTIVHDPHYGTVTGCKLMPSLTSGIECSGTSHTSGVPYLEAGPFANVCYYLIRSRPLKFVEPPEDDEELHGAAP